MGFGKKECAELMDWLIRVHFGVTLLVGLGVGTVVRALLRTYTKIPGVWILPLWLLSAAATMGLLSFLWNKYRPSTTQWLTPASSAIATNNSNEGFDVKEFLKNSYKSDMQSETENNITKWMNKLPPKERETLITRFIASGLIAYMHDTTWWTIFKSQILALEHINRQILRLENVKAYYDKAAQEYPIQYATYSFQQWFNYLLGRVLIIEQPANTVAITQRGKDYLKHMVHYGYSSNTRRL